MFIFNLVQIKKTFELHRFCKFFKLLLGLQKWLKCTFSNIHCQDKFNKYYHKLWQRTSMCSTTTCACTSSVHCWCCSAWWRAWRCATRAGNRASLTTPCVAPQLCPGVLCITPSTRGTNPHPPVRVTPRSTLCAQSDTLSSVCSAPAGFYHQSVTNKCKLSTDASCTSWVGYKNRKELKFVKNASLKF